MKGLSPTEAIYLKCLDCCCQDIGEVRKCGVGSCPLYPWHTKVVKHRELTEEQRQEMRDRMSDRMKRVNK